MLRSPALPASCRLFSISACLLLTAACGASFSPPARGDLGFGASRAANGSSELQLDFLSPDGGAGQLQFRHGATARDQVEVFTLAHGEPGERHAFVLAGAGYRRQLAEPEAPIQASFGFGAAGGVGGSHKDANYAIRHYPGVIASYVDFGAAFRLAAAVQLFAGGRIQRSVGITGKKAIRPPMTDWAQFGAGARFDAGPWFASVELGHGSFENALARDDEHIFGVALGARFGEPSRRPAKAARVQPATAGAD